MKVKLKKDIVIKRGTVFDTAPTNTSRDNTHIECIVGLGKNTAGSLIFSVNKDEDPQVGRWFEVL